MEEVRPDQPHDNLIQPEIPKKKNFLRFLWRLLKWTFFSVLFLVVAVIVLVFVYEDEAKKMAVEELNKHLNTEVKVDPKNIDLTILKTFPNAAIEFKNVIVYEALQKKNRDTIVDAGKISMQFNVMDLFHKKYNINKILVSNVKINFLTDKNGKHNFIFWKESKDTSGGNNGGPQEKLKFKLEQFDVENLEFSYKNKKEFIKAKGKSEHASFTGSFSDADFLLGANGKLFFDELILYKRSFLKNKNVTFKAEADVKGKDWSLRNAELAVNQLNISAKGNLTKTDTIIKCDLKLAGKDVDVKSVLSLLPENHKEKIKDYESDGNFYFNAALKGELSNFDKLEMNVQFGINKATVKHIPSNSVLTNVNLAGEYTKPMSGKDILTLKDISAQMNSNFVKGNCKFTDLSDPFIELNSSLNADLAELIKFYPIDTIQSLIGKIDLKVEISGRLKDLKNNYAGQKESTKGNARVSDLELVFKNSSQAIKIKSGEFIIQQNDLALKDVSMNPEENDLLINGELKNFIAWLLKENEPLNIVGKVKSNNIDMEKALAMFSGGSPSSSTATTNVSSTTTSSKEINISDKFNLDLELNVAKTKWGKFEAENVLGKLRVKEGKIFADELSFRAFDGDVTFSGIADASGDKIIFNGSSELVSVNVNKMFAQLNNFSQDVIQDKHLKGIATVSLAFSTRWSKKLDCDLSSINVSSDVLIERGELIQYKPLEALSKYVELSELKDIKFSTLKSHIDIKDRTISISKTEVKSSAMNIEISGTHTFENEIDYHFSILISELLARKPGKSKELDEELRLVENDPENKRTVFIRMTGTIDNPKFKYDRKAAKEKIKEDIKNEKKNLKQILKEEFGWFKKDTTLNKPTNDKNKKSDQKFIIEFGDDKKNKGKISDKDKKKEEDKKKKKEEDDDEDF